jgi:hypothetical protein
MTAREDHNLAQSALTTAQSAGAAASAAQTSADTALAVDMVTVGAPGAATPSARRLTAGSHVTLDTSTPGQITAAVPITGGPGLVYSGAALSALTVGTGLSVVGSSVIGRGGGAVDIAALTPLVWYKGGNYTLAASGQIASLTDLSPNGFTATKQAGVSPRTRALRVVTTSGAPAFTLETPFVTGNIAFPKMFTVHMVVRRKWNTVTNAYNAFMGIVNGATDGAGVSFTGATANDWQAGDLLVFGNGFTSGRAPRAISSGFPQFADNEWIAISARVGTSPAIIVNGYTLTLRTSTNTSQAGTNTASPLWIGSNPNTADQCDITAAMGQLVVLTGEQSDVAMAGLHNDMFAEYIGTL